MESLLVNDVPRIFVAKDSSIEQALAGEAVDRGDQTSPDVAVADQAVVVQRPTVPRRSKKSRASTNTATDAIPEWRLKQLRDSVASTPADPKQDDASPTQTNTSCDKVDDPVQGANDEGPKSDTSLEDVAQSKEEAALIKSKKKKKVEREGQTSQDLPIKKNEEKPKKPRANQTRVSKQGGKPKGIHNEFTHFPHDPNCKICVASRLQKAARPFKIDNARPHAFAPALKFGDRLTADHAIMNQENMSAEDEALVACVIQDGFSQWLQAFPCKTKSAQDTLRSFQ